MSDKKNGNLRVGIGGLGAIGYPVAKWLDAGVKRLELVAVSAGNRAKAESKISVLSNPVPVVSFSELAQVSDIVVECAPPELFMEIATPAIEAGCVFMPLSITSLLENMELIDRAEQTGARIIAPTGALIGFDALRAAAMGEVYSVLMATRKPPTSLKTAKFVVEQGIDLDRITEPLKLYEGSVREAAAMFPANVNVAVGLSLAGIGVDKTQYEIWADPSVTRNTHNIKVDADSTRFEITIAGVPTVETPGTGKLTPLSVMATLESLVATLSVGT